MIIPVALSSVLLSGQASKGGLDLPQVRMVFPETLSVGGVRWKVPARWSAYRYSGQSATYQVPAAPGDLYMGEFVVSAYDIPSGGDLLEVLGHWTKLFQTPERLNCLLDHRALTLDSSACGPQQDAKIQKRTIHGLNVATADVSGTYVSSGKPIVWASAREPTVELAKGNRNPDYRMLGAVVEGKRAQVFFRLIGPKKTVAAARAEFQAMVRSIRLYGKPVE